MGWRDNMQPGSFRGAPFLATSSDLSFGRNAEVHEIPLGEQPYPEDLGRKARRFALECFVTGATYMAQRDTLLAAFERSGPGTLIHPWMGTMSVQVLDGRLRESKDNGGMAVFTVSLVPAAPTTTPAPSADTQAQASAQADATDAQGQASLASRLNAAGKPAFVQQGAVDVLGAIGRALGVATSASGCVGVELFELRAGIGAISSQALTLLSSPATLASQVQGLFGQIAALAAYPEDALAALQGAMGFGSALPTPASSTTSGQIEAANQAAIVQVVQAAAATAAVRVASTLEFDSYDQAASVRDALGEAIDDVAISAAVAGDNALWSSLDALRLAMVTDLTARGASLARLYAYTPVRTEPALVIAYRLYGDASQADALVARNAIVHPGFVPGAQPIQVLTDD